MSRSCLGGAVLLSRLCSLWPIAAVNGTMFETNYRWVTTRKNTPQQTQTDTDHGPRCLCLSCFLILSRTLVVLRQSVVLWLKFAWLYGHSFLLPNLSLWKCALNLVSCGYLDEIYKWIVSCFLRRTTVSRSMLPDMVRSLLMDSCVGCSSSFTRWSCPLTSCGASVARAHSRGGAACWLSRRSKIVCIL